MVVVWLVPPETNAVSAQVLCTPFNHATKSNHLAWGEKEGGKKRGRGGVVEARENMNIAFIGTIFLWIGGVRWR